MSRVNHFGTSYCSPTYCLLCELFLYLCLQLFVSVSRHFKLEFIWRKSVNVTCWRWIFNIQKIRNRIPSLRSVSTSHCVISQIQSQLSFPQLISFISMSKDLNIEVLHSYALYIAIFICEALMISEYFIFRSPRSEHLQKLNVIKNLA